jgi:hypothetical protein
MICKVPNRAQWIRCDIYLGYNTFIAFKNNNNKNSQNEHLHNSKYRSRLLTK